MARGRALQLAENFCGRNGLGWHRRLQLVHAGLSNAGGFPDRIAGYLGKKYGYEPTDTARNSARVLGLLGEFAAVLRTQRDAGHEYYLGAALSAVDIYSATFMALFRPQPEENSAMYPGVRSALEWMDAPTAAALDPILLEHRDRVYARHLELPLAL